MSDGTPSLADAVSILRGLIEYIDGILALIPEERRLHARYRDDAAYRRRFDDELKRLSELDPNERPNPWWPENLEPRPLDEYEEAVTPRDLEPVLRAYCAEGPCEILFAAIQQALMEYNGCDEGLRDMNCVLPLCLHSRGAAPDSSSRFHFRGALEECARTKFTEAMLDEMVDDHCRASARLKRYCLQAMKLIEALSQVRVDESTFAVHWEGKTCQLGHTQQFRLIQQLEKEPRKFLPFALLATRMGGCPDDNIAHVKSRLVKTLQEAGMSELADCIRTQTGYYGLFLP